MQRVIVAVVLAILVQVWRSKNSLVFLTLSDFPVGYYSNGDWKTHCEIITHKPDTAFRYCEDAVFWDHLDSAGKQANRLILLSCDPGRKAWNTVMGPLRDPKPHGALWVYSPEKNSPPHRITFKGYPQGHDFHPLGLEIYPSHGGSASNLFVVNHARQRTFIEQFSMSPERPTEATWVRTIQSKYFVAPNALALTSPTSFYVTNDHLMTRRLPKPFGSVLPLVETWLGLPFGWLSHVSIEESGSTTTVVEHSFAAFGIPFANGVALSHNGSQVAIASSSGAEVYFYARNPQSNALTYTHAVPVPFLPDNIMYDDMGALIVAGHPHLSSLVSVAKNHTDKVAPSWILSVSPRSEAEGVFVPKPYDTRAVVSASSKAPAVRSHEVETLMQSNGKLWSTSATGLRDSRTGKLYVTGLYAEGLLVCKP
jgi:3',5'-cyclic AMP phosphodiesterase CpdA